MDKRRPAWMHRLDLDIQASEQVRAAWLSRLSEGERLAVALKRMRPYERDAFHSLVAREERAQRRGDHARAERLYRQARAMIATQMASAIPPG